MYEFFNSIINYTTHRYILITDVADLIRLKISKTPEILNQVQPYLEQVITSNGNNSVKMLGKMVSWDNALIELLEQTLKVHETLC